MSPNGSGRLDRVEHNLERITGILERLTGVVQKLTERQIELDERLATFITVTEQHIASLKKAQEQTLKNVNSLIRVMKDLPGTRPGT